MSDLIRQTTSWLTKWIPALPSSRGQVTEIERVVVRELSDSMLTGPGRYFIRAAGVSGALAVIFGAYGAHVFRPGKAEENLKITYETGNRYHFFHTLALLGVPLTRKPVLVGSLMCAGMVLFSGSCYYHALTGNMAIRQVTPYGGMLLIAAWVAMIL